MPTAVDVSSTHRYAAVPARKAGGATYTPRLLADFVAAHIVEAAQLPSPVIHVLDPALGDGELLLSLLRHLSRKTATPVVAHGFDVDAAAVAAARQRLQEAFPTVELRLENGDFLDFAARRTATDSLFATAADDATTQRFDLIIANPPYVRTQIIGAQQAQRLAAAFGLSGRIDLYHAFLIGIARVLKPTGTAGIIVSNRFMTTRGGGSLRAALRARFTLRHVWDLGDTKLFEAAVLPAVLLADGVLADGVSPAKQRIGEEGLPRRSPLSTSQRTAPAFTTIYQTQEAATVQAPDPVAALSLQGVVGLPDGRRFAVQHGLLDCSGSDALWRIATARSDLWLSTVAAHTWNTFRAIGKVRVGVKTCADKVFIRSNWDSYPIEKRPELLRPLMTHHAARRFRANEAKQTRRILYPHESVAGQRRASDLSLHPKSRAYLEAHRAALEARSYLIEGGRQWYELWVPQDPAAWDAPKLVFRDIAERPTFWLDLDGSIVNGDCYWMTAEREEARELLWLAAAVANSSFIEAFYDHRFNNKLYAGRRRFMTQYVAQFPLPDPERKPVQDIIALTKDLYARVDNPEAADLETRLNQMVWRAFGLEAVSS